ncbi:MAG: efflux RND transporter periplasmic adaptor subunit [Pleurocapsa sp.]
MEFKLKPPLLWLTTTAGVSLFFLAGITYVVLHQSQSPVNFQELTVPVTQQNFNVEITASGRVEPIKSVNVSPKNPGRLVKLLVEQGDRVMAGQTLAIMENSELQAQNAQAVAELQQAVANLAQNKTKINTEIAQARARLEQAQARLSQAQARIPTNIAQAKAQIDSAESQLKLVEERVKRNKYLLQQGGISQDTFDEVLNDYQNALSRVRELKQQLEQLELTGGSEVEQLQAEIREAQIALQQRQQMAQDEIAGLQAAVNASEAAHQRSEIQYEDTIVKAPFEGIITQRYAVEGAFVTPSTSASSTASASATSILALAQGLEVVAKVAELDIGQLRSQQKVKIFADAYPEQEFLGEIKRIAPEAIIEDNVTSFEVRIELITGQEWLRSKMNVDVVFIGEVLPDTLVVPTVAIVTQEGETGVMVLSEDNKPEFIPVKIGLTIGDKTQILSGIDRGQRVFIDLPKKR